MGTITGTLDANGDVSIADTNIAFDGASTTFTTTGAFTLTPGGAVTLGDGGDTLSLSSSDWAIGATGDMTGIGAITADGAITFSGVGAGTDNSVLVISDAGVLSHDEIDPDVWTAGTLIDGSGSAGQATFWTDADTVSGNNDFFWDNTNELLGIGLAGSPVHKLDVSGAVTGKALMALNETGDQAILVASSSGTTTFVLNNDGTLRTVPIASSSLTDEGTVYYDSDDDNLYVYANGGWVDLTTQGATYTADNGLTLTGTEFDWGGTLSAATTITQGNYGTTFDLTGTGDFVISDNGTPFASFVDTGKFGIGDVSPEGMFEVDGAITGQALVQLNETGDQAILTASGSGTTRFTLDRDGSITQTSADTTTNAYDLLADSLTTGTAMNISVDALTTGTGMLIDNATNTLTTGTLLQVQSTATSLTTAADAFLGYYNWNPGSSTTATGDLIRINIGANGNVTNLLNITDNGSTLFRVSETQIESAVPHAFSAAGDVSMAYDLVFTNQTAATIDSYGPLTIRSGESFESNNLTLKTYNSGDIVFDIPETGAAIFQGAFALDSQQAFAAADTTPDVSAGSHFITSGTETITDFDGAHTGQVIYIESAAATVFDVTASGLTGGDTNLTTAAGDLTAWIYDGADWILISFMDVSGTQTGSDLAEYFPSNDILEPGEIVKVDPENPEHVIRSASAYESSVVGIVSSDPGMVLGEEDESAHPIALAGRVPVGISASSEEIIPGDYITTSSEAGLAMKANAKGRVIGQALEAWNCSGLFGSGDAGDSPEVADGSENCKDQITVFINNTWYDPEPQLANIIDFNLVESLTPDLQHLYDLVDIEGEKVNKIGAFANLIVGNIEAGAIIAKELAVEGAVNVAGNIKAGAIETISLVSPTIQTNEISPIDGDLVINLDSSSDGTGSSDGGHSGFGKLLIKAGEEVVAEIDEAGNATFSGELASESLKTNEVYTEGVTARSASIAGELRVGKIYADEIVGLDAKFADASVNTLSGITREEIEELLREAESDQSILSQTTQWEIGTATGSASLNELALENLYVSGTTALSSLSISESMVIGNDLVISSQTLEDDSLITSIDSIESPLSIQSSASQPLHLMAGLVTIDTNGNVQIAGSLAVRGNLAVGGAIETSSLTLKAKDYSSDGGGEPVESNSSEVESGFGKLLALYNEAEEEVAAISATGAAHFAQVETDKLTIASDPEATSSTSFSGLIYETNASAGTARILEGANSAVIRNPNVTENSLIFVTPTSETESALFIKEQAEGEFIVGFASPVQEEVEFNWWVVGIAD